MNKTFLFFLLQFSFFANAQQLIIGQISTDGSAKVPNVLVLNMNTNEQTYSDNSGNYLLKASVNDEVRFIKQNFERVNVKIKPEDFTKPFNISMRFQTQNIEEVEIAFRPSGNLKKDNALLNDSRKVAALKNDISYYIIKKSDPSILRPKQGDFVQPVGSGFSIGKVHDKWEDADLMSYLMTNIGDNFFVTELKLKKSEIPSFILQVLKNFERKKILKYGYCDDKDFNRFFNASFDYLPHYHSGK